MRNFKTILATMRIPFLLLTPVCVFLGLSVAVNLGHRLDSVAVILISVAALSAHISVNMLNEYFDYKSGLDAITERTPFSGGSGGLIANPAALNQVLYIGTGAIVLTILIGLYFLIQLGLQVLPIGIAGVFLVLFYTSYINKSPWLCLIAPGLGFGILFVSGTQFIFTGDFKVTVWLTALVPFFLVNNLLLLNQYPDIEADKKTGRNHLPIALGVSAGNWVYLLFLLLTVAVIIFMIWKSLLPVLSLIALIPVPLGLVAWTSAVKYGKDIGQKPQFLAMNVILTLTAPLLLAVSLII